MHEEGAGEVVRKATLQVGPSGSGSRKGNDEEKALARDADPLEGREIEFRGERGLPVATPRAVARARFRGRANGALTGKRGESRWLRE